jgi:hypothetical protein
MPTALYSALMQRQFPVPAAIINSIVIVELAVASRNDSPFYTLITARL